MTNSDGFRRHDNHQGNTAVTYSSMFFFSPAIGCDAGKSTQYQTDAGLDGCLVVFFHSAGGNS